jgi:hypothetical protein
MRWALELLGGDAVSSFGFFFFSLARIISGSSGDVATSREKFAQPGD